MIHLVVCWGISHFFTATRNITEGVGEKIKRTNEHNGLGSTQSARRVVLWHCIPCVFVDKCWHVFARNFYKLLGMLTHLWPSSSQLTVVDSELWIHLVCLPHYPWTLSHTVWSLMLSVVDCPSASPFVNSLSGFLYQLFSSPTSSLVGDLESKPFVQFCAKTDKGIVCLADHPHSVT